ncbi:hypothetical protein [Gilvibacter sp.]|uniref:hypothetical protein n=1 Tax=Gilvibacter sp. TaxID=2729997 RepID=UPI003B51F0A2
MLTHLYYEPLEGDEESIEKQLELLKKFPQEYLDKFITQWNTKGLDSTHKTATIMLAVHLEYIRRINKSPLYFECNSIIGIKPLSELSEQERLSRMQYELKAFGEIRSDDLKVWWINRY